MKLFILAATLLLAAPADAQSRMTTGDCTQSWAAVETMTGMGETGIDFAADDEGWCLVEQAEFDISNNQKIRLGSVRWRATDIARFIDEGLPPRAFEIVGEGFGTSATTGDPVFDYLFALQASLPQSGFGLNVRWDGVQNTVHVDEAYLDFFTDNRIEATARIVDINLTDQATIETSIGTMGLRDLIVISQVNGWFETYVAMTLGPMLLDRNGVEPEAQVAALQQQAVEIVNQLPDTVVPSTSRDALAAFITSLPKPRGTARIQLSADPSIGAVRMAPFALMSEDPTVDQIVELGLDGVAFLFTWTPTGDAE